MGRFHISSTSRAFPPPSTLCMVSPPPQYPGNLEPILGILDVLKPISSNINSSTDKQGGGIVKYTLTLVTIQDKTVTGIHSFLASHTYTHEEYELDDIIFLSLYQSILQMNKRVCQSTSYSYSYNFLLLLTLYYLCYPFIFPPISPII